MKKTFFSRFVLLQLFILFAMSPAMKISAQSKIIKDPDVIGRWDLTIEKDGKSLPSWLEVQKSGLHTLVGRFTYAGGSARPISEVMVADGKYSFSIPPQWEDSKRNLDFEFEVNGNAMQGTMVYIDGITYKFTGVRAPALIRDKAPVWGSPIRLFNGKDLSGWHADGKNQWIVSNGLLTSPHAGSNIITDKTFNDFKLHVEFRYGQGANSGVYLRGRYEVQIIDTKSGAPEPINNQFSAIYGVLPPNQMMAKDPGQWQTYDITLIGRLVTVVANGRTVICKAVIPGITGGAIDSKEGEPGPIYFQCEAGPVEFRNVVITPAK
jgi:hypothetical protein